MFTSPAPGSCALSFTTVENASIASVFVALQKRALTNQHVSALRRVSVVIAIAL
jgi:hypothetical protein